MNNINTVIRLFMEDFTCRICNHSFRDAPLWAYETRFGWNDKFKYMRCPHCGTYQISSYPEDIEKYYSNAYYSMKKLSSDFHGKAWKVFIQRSILKYKIQQKSILGKLFSVVLSHMYTWVLPHMFDFHSKILDVGCGSGERILRLAHCGFYNVSGIDPFLDEDISYTITPKHSITIKKKQLDEVTDKYDCVMLHHVIEHMPDPCAVLTKLPNLLNKEGVLLIALPVISRFGWEQYDMLSLPFADAPRHYHIFEYEYFVKLVQSFGFTLTASTFQFDERIMHDARGNYSEYAKNFNKNVLRRKLIQEKDTGIAVLYFKLNS